MISSKPVGSIDELMLLHDEDFVHWAYLSILGRPADPSGLYSYSLQIRRGVDKYQIIAALANSSEGQSLPAQRLPGLQRALEHAKHSKPSWFGKLVRRAACAVFYPVINELGAIERRIARLDQVEPREVSRSSTASESPHVVKVESRKIEELRTMSMSARDVYFRLKDAAAEHERKVVR